MALTRAAKFSNHVVNAQTLDDISLTAGSLLVVLLGRSNGPSGTFQSEPSASGLDFDLIIQSSNIGDYSEAEIWTAVVPTTANYDITFTIGNTYWGAVAEVVEFLGARTDAIGGLAAMGGTSANVNGPFSFDLDDDPASTSYVEALFVMDNEGGGNSVQAGVGWTETTDIGTGAGSFQTQYRTGSVSPTVSWVDVADGSSGTYYSSAAVAIEILESGGAPPPDTNKFFQFL